MSSTTQGAEPTCPTGSDGHHPTYWKGACVVCDSLAAIVAAQDASTLRAELQQADVALEIMHTTVREVRAERDDNLGGYRIWRRRCEQAEEEREQLHQEVARRQWSMAAWWYDHKVIVGRLRAERDRLAAERDSAARVERERIVAWLRGADPVDVALGGSAWAAMAADALERGEHEEAR